MYFFKLQDFSLLNKRKETIIAINSSSKYPSPNLVIKRKKISVFSEQEKIVCSEKHDTCFKKKAVNKIYKLQ